MSHFDVVIVGGGIAGASLGACLAARVRVAIIEAEEHCAIHATGRSAAFWLAHYGGPSVMPLTLASHADLEAGWPTGERSWLRRRGAITIARQYMDLREALSMQSSKAPLAELRRPQMEVQIPGLREDWDFGVYDAGCSDIDVGGLHAACLATFKRNGGTLICAAPLHSALRRGALWILEAGAERLTAATLANAAGAWADSVASRCGVRLLGIEPRRRTIVQLRVGRSGVRNLPLVNDALERFYFKGESDNRVWVSPHDETPSEPCDAAPEEIDIATAIDRFESVVDWPVERVERSWAGLRSFAPDRVPVYGFDVDAPNFFWCAGQGGFGIQTAPAGAKTAAALLLEDRDSIPIGIDPSRYAPRRFDR